MSLCVQIDSEVLLWIYYIKEAHMAKLGHEKVKELIDQMGHYDPDNMEMAAKRVSQLIISKQINFEDNPKIADQIREAFMKQIQSENDTVQSEAIKYLAQIVPQLPSQQVEQIYEKILGHITHVEQSQKKRERYGACAAAVIHQAPEQYGLKLGNLFLKSVQLLLQNQDKKLELEVILINIITQFLRKWSNVATRFAYDKKSLLIYLLKNIELKSKLQIIKKSQSCLGKLALVLDKQLVEVALNDKDWGLLRFIGRNQSTTSVQQLKHARNGLLCLSQILKSHNIELRYWAKEMSHLLLNTINNFKASQDIDQIEVICDILDAALTALSFVIRTFSRELRDQLTGQLSPYCSFLRQLLEFNVQGMMCYAGQQMQEEGYQEDDYDGYYQQAQADQKCWKVRRAVLYYISFLIKYDKSFLQSMKEGELIQNLGSKLVEEHSMVSQMAFSTFNQLVQLISIDRALTSDELAVEEISLQRVKSSAKEIADRIIKEISSRVRVILNNNKFSDQLKTQAGKILLKLVQIYHQHLLNNQAETFSLFNFIQQELKRTTIPECKANLLQSLRQLLSERYPFDRYQQIYDYCLQCLNNNASAKIQIIAWNTLRRFLQLFSQQIGGNPQKLQNVVGLVINKLKELDSDKGIKVATCKCLAVIISHYTLKSNDLCSCLDILAHKLKIQVEKVYIVNTLSHFKEQKLSKESIQAVQNVVRQCAESLGSTNYELNQKCIESIDRLLSVLGSQCSVKLMQQLLQKSKLLLGQGKIPLFVRHISSHQPKLLKPYAQLIVKSTESEYIVTLINNKVIDVSECLSILKKIDQEKSKKISQTIGAIRIDERNILKEVGEDSWGRIMVGALGYVGNDKTLPSLYKYLNDFKSDQAKKDVCSAIGNIISKNVDSLLPNFLNKASSEKDSYLSLVILRQTLNFSSKSFSCMPQLVQWLFARSQLKSQVQSNFYIIAECLGKAALLSSEATQSIVANSSSTSPSRRFVVASSLRFAMENENEIREELVEKYLAFVVRMMGDEKVTVREGAVKSLTAVCQSYRKGIKQWAHDQQFWQKVLMNSKINDSLISIIDYGLCKETKDQGKSLRLESFNLLQILTKKVHMETPVIELAMETALARISDQTSNDIVLKRLTLIRSLCELEFSPFIRLQNQFLTKVNPKDGLLKKYQKGASEQRLEVYLKGILRQIWLIGELAKQQKVDKIGELIIDLRNSPFYQPLIEQLQFK